MLARSCLRTARLVRPAVRNPAGKASSVRVDPSHHDPIHLESRLLAAGHRANQTVMPSVPRQPRVPPKKQLRRGGLRRWRLLQQPLRSALARGTSTSTAAMSLP